ncbi:hypothetical protein EMWEY_00055420 [Eimeria maxima]|uniref:Uncharacterized protein n=1 Tax=Eimeria maxima TaxID=5804 RepID=U6MBP8_EIMMA|nr:hypothetical protein EMWEY_00055420 [Eimeria maxima]CDJ59065.1 hypothetical protein EMWEY_00055420 [Eimeria maxima]
MVRNLEQVLTLMLVSSTADTCAGSTKHLNGVQWLALDASLCRRPCTLERKEWMAMIWERLLCMNAPMLSTAVCEDILQRTQAKSRGVNCLAVISDVQCNDSTSATYAQYALTPRGTKKTESVKSRFTISVLLVLSKASPSVLQQASLALRSLADMARESCINTPLDGTPMQPIASPQLALDPGSMFRVSSSRKQAYSQYLAELLGMCNCDNRVIIVGLAVCLLTSGDVLALPEAPFYLLRMPLKAKLSAVAFQLVCEQTWRLTHMQAPSVSADDVDGNLSPARPVPVGGRRRREGLEELDPLQQVSDSLTEHAEAKIRLRSLCPQRCFLFSVCL